MIINALYIFFSDGNSKFIRISDGRAESAAVLPRVHTFIGVCMMSAFPNYGIVLLNYWHKLLYSNLVVPDEKADKIVPDLSNS